MNGARHGVHERRIVLGLDQIERGVERIGGVLAPPHGHLQPRLLNEETEPAGQRQIALAGVVREFAGAGELADGHQQSRQKHEG